MHVSDILTPTDLQQLETRGISLENLQQQLAWFQRGFPFIGLQRPCTAGDGITLLSLPEIEQLISLHDHAAQAGRVMKFVPASGAASRMFQSFLSLNNRSALTSQDVAQAAASGGRDCQQ